MKENWKDIEENLKYEISDMGRIRNKKKGLIRKAKLDRNGYLCINIRLSGKLVTRCIHRLVAKTFVNNDENYEIVDHINNDRTDNRACILRWVNPSKNMNNKSFYGMKTIASIIFLHNKGLSALEISKRLSK